jgi:hypothetical protein
LNALRGLCALALAALPIGCAQPQLLPDDLDGKPWEVQKALLPPYPKEGNWIPFYVGPARPFAFFVDSVSVTVWRGGVVRYTLIARSPSAATNVSYESIRCDTYERKIYAFGRDDGTWAQARNSEWLPIDRSQANQQQSLADDFFCSGRRVQTPEEAVQALARGNRPG